MFDADMRHLAASARWREEHRLGDDVVGKSHYELFPDIPERWKQAHSRALAGESLRAEKDGFTRRCGSLQWLRWQVQPWRGADGEIGGVIVSAENITDRVRAQEAPGRSEARLRIALAAAGVGVRERNLQSARPLGVGLSLCRTIIQNHGGDIGCCANAPQGATFWFTLPAIERQICESPR